MAALMFTASVGGFDKSRRRCGRDHGKLDGWRRQLGRRTRKSAIMQKGVGAADPAIEYLGLDRNCVTWRVA